MHTHEAAVFVSFPGVAYLHIVPSFYSFSSSQYCRSLFSLFADFPSTFLLPIRFFVLEVVVTLAVIVDMGIDMSRTSCSGFWLGYDTSAASKDDREEHREDGTGHEEGEGRSDGEATCNVAFALCNWLQFIIVILCVMGLILYAIGPSEGRHRHHPSFPPLFMFSCTHPFPC